MAITIKAARINVGLLRADVQKRLKAEFNIKISINTLASYENGTTQPNISTAKALASIYGRTVDELIFL